MVGQIKEITKMLGSAFAALADRMRHPHAKTYLPYEQIWTAVHDSGINSNLSLALSAHPTLLRHRAGVDDGYVKYGFANDVPVVVAEDSLVYPNADMHTGRGWARTASVLDYRRVLPRFPGDSRVKDCLEISLTSTASFGVDERLSARPLLKLSGSPDVRGLLINEISIGGEKVAALPKRAKAALNTLISLAGCGAMFTPADNAIREFGRDKTARTLLLGAEKQLVRSFGPPI
jgi:hypothetical protein